MPDTIYSIRPRQFYRRAVGALFFLQGICFATWASRIPSIQQQLSLSDGALGLILFALPIGSMTALGFSGSVVTRLGSRRTAILALSLYSAALVLIGLMTTKWTLAFSLVLFGLAGNLSNIAINTQAVGVEALYQRKIMASFHGLWSLAGFSAAGIGTYMIGKSITPLYHFAGISLLILAGVAICFRYLLPREKKQTVQQKSKGRLDKTLVQLGIICFCCMICEGAMFDWSGIYFQKVVEAPGAWVGAGYTSFMLTMAGGRFVADWVSNRIGFRKTVQLSGLLITTGLLLAVVIPNLYTAIAGFLIVGFGVSSVVPLVYSEAGRTAKTAPGLALAAVSSIGFMGFLVGPPLIGSVAALFSLRISFLLIALMGLAVVLFIRLIKLNSQSVAQPEEGRLLLLKNTKTKNLV
jgi:MFS family permease